MAKKKKPVVKKPIEEKVETNEVQIDNSDTELFPTPDKKAVFNGTGAARRLFRKMKDNE